MAEDRHKSGCGHAFGFTGHLHEGAMLHAAGVQSDWQADETLEADGRDFNSVPFLEVGND
jgi:hypothetical protein